MEDKKFAEVLKLETKMKETKSFPKWHLSRCFPSIIFVQPRKSWGKRDLRWGMEKRRYFSLFSTFEFTEFFSRCIKMLFSFWKKKIRREVLMKRNR